MHPHHNFTIMAFVLGGALTHINTIGKIDELKRDDYYVFSAGSGGKHSELNIGEGDMHAIYVWVLPGRLLAPPSYRRGRFDRQANANRITCLVGDAPGALPIALYSAALFTLTEGRAYSAAEYRGWLTDAGLKSGEIIPTLIHCGVLFGVN